MKSEVYFSRLGSGRNRGECLVTLLNGIEGYISSFGQGSCVGIKMTVGDEHSTGYIKPEVVKILVDNIRKRGAKPFLFDTNVIYSGQRQNAVDHLNLAFRKGFTPENVGCPYIIADSVFGTDSRTITVDAGGMREIRVPSLVSVIDDLIVLTHITGHIMSGFAGSVKNVAMGMASRAGKQIQHSSVKPSIHGELCTGCGCCSEICPAGAVTVSDDRAAIDPQRCIGCAECIGACKFNAVKINWREDVEVFVERMAEYALGILSRITRRVFINVALDVTEECDCISGDDPRIADDTGMFASRDILAADKACFDILTRKGDIFLRGEGEAAHRHLFEYAGKIGLGSLDYRLIEL